MDLEAFKSYLDSPEGKESIDAFLLKAETEESVLMSQLKRFHDRWSDRLCELTDLVLKKYSSSSYIDRWYKRGIEPQNELLWFLFCYAKRYGNPPSEETRRRFENMFTGEMYEIGGYCFQVMHGQGSVVRADKTGTGVQLSFRFDE